VFALCFTWPVDWPIEEAEAQTPPPSSGDCDVESTIQCNHFENIATTDTIHVGQVNFEISGDGDYILYSDIEKYHFFDVDKAEIVESDYLLPDQGIGVDAHSGLAMVYGNDECFFPMSHEVQCILNETKVLDLNLYQTPVNYLGAYHSSDYIICDLPHSDWGDSHCDWGFGVSDYEKDGQRFSPDGKYEMWFTSFLVDKDMFVDDYDGVVSYGEVLKWDINIQNSTAVQKSITRVDGGLRIESYTKDDVYSLVWASDSEYAYVITCNEIFGINPIENTVETLGKPPILCDSDWDSVDDKVDYIPKLGKISIDGSLLVYLDGQKLVIIQLNEGTIVDSIGVIGMLVLLGFIVTGIVIYLKRRDLI